MKINQIFSAVMVVTTIGATALAVTPAVAQAKSKTSLATYPSSIRGTWYHYEEHDGYYYKTMTFGAKKLTMKNYFDAFGKQHAKWTSTLHAVKKPNDFRYGDSKKKMHWAAAVARKGGYTQVIPYGYFATSGEGSYKMIHKTYKGKSVKVLYSKNMSRPIGLVPTDHYYQTKAQAKHFNSVGALHK